jgi:hypothetical protein
VLVAGEFGADGGLNLQLFREFTNESGLGRLAVLDLSAWELPLESVPIPLAALAHEYAAAAVDDAGRD